MALFKINYDDNCNRTRERYTLKMGTMSMRVETIVLADANNVTGSISPISICEPHFSDVV